MGNHRVYVVCGEGRGVGFLIFLQVYRSSPLITNVSGLNETLLYVANFTAMNPKRWRRVRNLALLVALLVTAIQLCHE